MNFIQSKILSKSSSNTEVDIMGSGKINISKTSKSSKEGDIVKLGLGLSICW